MAIIFALMIGMIGGSLGYMIGKPIDHALTGAFCGFVLLFGSYLAYALEILNEKEAKVLQIFGRYSRCLNSNGNRAGLYFISRPFEKVFRKVTVQQDFPIQLYRDAGERAEVDFTDCSSVINATAWIRVIDPKKFTYEVTDPERYAENSVDAATRPEFAVRTLDQANADKSDIASKSLPLINEGVSGTIGMIEKTGAEMTRLFIEDFAFPADVKEIRKQYLQGETDAKRLRAKMDGIINSITLIAQGYIKMGLPQEEAAEKATNVFFEQTGMETIREAKANMTFVAEKVKGMLGFFAATGSQGGNP